MAVEARIPCPQCGGFIHPIAGKCKHCKTDLRDARAAKPQALAQLPSLKAATAPAPAMAPPAAPSPPAALPRSTPISAAPVRESAPILPPRVTARQPVQGGTRSSSVWRSWPVIVIILSVIAIIGAGVLWAWPDNDKDSKHAVKKTDLGPAPDRMNTESLPPPPATPAPPPPAPKPAPTRVDPIPAPPPPAAPATTPDGSPIERDLKTDPWDNHTQIPDINDLLDDGQVSAR